MIDAATLKTVRRARKFGRAKLAKLSGLTERQIARLEGTAPVKSDLSQDIVLRISAALQVPAEVLRGELPLIEDDLIPAAQKHSNCTSGCCG